LKIMIIEHCTNFMGNQIIYTHWTSFSNLQNGSYSITTRQNWIMCLQFFELTWMQSYTDTHLNTYLFLPLKRASYFEFCHDSRFLSECEEGVASQVCPALYFRYGRWSFLLITHTSSAVGYFSGTSETWLNIYTTMGESTYANHLATLVYDCSDNILVPLRGAHFVYCSNEGSLIYIVLPITCIRTYWQERNTFFGNVFIAWLGILLQIFSENFWNVQWGS
jgi:hypothetical protein